MDDMNYEMNNNEFTTVGIKDRVLNFWYNFKKYIILVSVLIIVLIVILIILLKPKQSVLSNYSNIERIMILNAQNYVKNNNVDGDIYVSLNNLNIKLDEKLKCNIISGVYKNGKNYTPYLLCKDYKSQSIKDIEDENTLVKEYAVLKGDNPQIINETTYQESGIDVKDNNYQVNIKGNDIDDGLNIVTYYVNDNGKNLCELKRIVIAEEIQGNYPVLTLLGEKTKTIPVGSRYAEQGYKAIDEKDGNITDKVKVTGSVDISNPGTYKLKYSVTNSRGKTRTEVRTIIVNENNINLNMSHTTDIKDKSATITLIIGGSGYKYTILPDNSESTSSTVNYTVYKNGTYDFIVYDKNNNSEVYSVTIKELDSTPPVLTCKGILGDDKTNIEITANEDIDYYLYDTEKSNSNKKEYSKNLEKLVVSGYDMSGNKSSVTCEVGKNMYYEILDAPVKGTLVRASTSKTLDVKIYKASEGYIAYIWALNPFEQFNKATSDWGVNRMLPSTMLDREVQRKNLQNKIVIGVNGSGFYEKGSWFPSCSSSKYCDVYHRTTEGALTITDGKVIRNWYYDAAKDKGRNHSVYGLLPNGKLMAWPKVNSYTESERKELFETIINSGIKNTFVFRPTILLDGNDVGDTTMDIGKANRQIFCQRNTNNFVFLTAPGTGSTRAARISFLRSIGCKTAVNFDGGGSISMVFKDKNESSMQKIVGNGRSVVDSAYFTE